MLFYAVIFWLKFNSLRNVDVFYRLMSDDYIKLILHCIVVWSAKNQTDLPVNFFT